jgi:hypothetical protein
MPRLYLTPSEILEMPIGLGLSSSLSALSSEQIGKLLARASQSCDSECRRRLQAPGSTTLAQSCSAGATQISVSSTNTLDELDEQAVQIGTGGNQETILIEPGGVTVTTWTGSYPGSINLASGLQFSHSSSEPVVFLYKETTEAGGSSSSDPYAQAALTQETQIAESHMGGMWQGGGLTRVVFLKAYPIINISAIEHAFSFASQFNTVDVSAQVPLPSEGWYRFEPGTMILREGIMRTTYTGGFQTVPDDIKEATSLFFAVQMRQMINPYGTIELHLGKRRQKWAATGNDKDPLIEQACSILKKYKRTV